MSRTQTQADTLNLPDELTIAEVGDYHQRLLAMLAEDAGVALDAGAVTRVDTAWLQLLVVIQRALLEAGGGIQWAAVSEAFSESAVLLGLSEQLGLPEAA